jgi:hypothetical protein
MSSKLPITTREVYDSPFQFPLHTCLLAVRSINAEIQSINHPIVLSANGLYSWQHWVFICPTDSTALLSKQSPNNVVSYARDKAWMFASPSPQRLTSTSVRFPRCLCAGPSVPLSFRLPRARSLDTVNYHHYETLEYVELATNRMVRQRTPELFCVSVDCRGVRVCSSGPVVVSGILTNRSSSITMCKVLPFF